MKTRLTMMTPVMDFDTTMSRAKPHSMKPIGIMESSTTVRTTDTGRSRSVSGTSPPL